MKRNALFSSHRNSRIRCHRTLAAVLLLYLLGGYSYARLTPADLAAIAETGLTPLTGEQEDEYPGRDYVIVETMRISRSKTVTFAPGTRLYFHPSARLIINGTLRCNGIVTKPISIGKLTHSLPKLSSEPAMVFDSTLIFIQRGGSLYLHHTTLADSSVRVRLTDITSAFSLDSVTCAGNRFMLPDTLLLFPPEAMVTCTNERGAVAEHCTWTFPEGKKKATIPTNNFQITPMLVTRIALGVGAVAAMAAGAYFYNKAAQASSSYYDERDPADARRYRELHNSDLRRYYLSIAGGACLAAGLSVTFFIKGKQP